MHKPFQIEVTEDQLNDLSARLKNFRIPPSPEDRGWEDGTSLSYLNELVSYWRNSFDWRAQEKCLNQFKHFLADIDGMKVHFIHEKGEGPAPLPLILFHGWPDGFQRFLKLIPLLTNPSKFGGAEVDAFDVIVPSLPGYGFSQRGAEGPTRKDFGNLFHRLMTEELQYSRYGAHGGDVGAAVCDQLCDCYDDKVVGVHFTNVPMNRTANLESTTEAEKKFLEQMQKFQQFGGGYMHLQGTKPWTPAAALNDSPAGLAAWIVEKMYAWSDCGDDVETKFSKDEILTNVMLYWITQTIGTSFLTYRDFMKPSISSGSGVTAGEPVRRTPTGFANFPKEIASPPREWADRFYNVQHWTELAAGGHFAAWEEPELLAEDIRTFFRPLR